ncbi:hypothetical protein M0R89_05195 [Halorussus limi]|uniref:Uncharacterized protein n=1 Tax=Halorussus limi TaxID=2938695 RepID=A0A8U0HY44_9EURY|nr:hypothetical protein [Halorussus limi]UPV75464.1 hypothetical protein M0R89_05195 [Halorussus limi]
MRRSLALAVGLLLVLAGCNAFPGGETDTTSEVTTRADGTTVSEATTGEPTETAGGSALPPGLSANSVTDAAALAAAHEQVLANQTYTYDRKVRVVADNGSELGRWGQHTQVGAERLRFNHTQTGTGVSVAGITIEDSRVYTNGSVTFWNASAYRDGYRRVAGRGFAETTFSSEQLLADVLNGSATSVTSVAPPEETGGVESDGGQWYRVRAEGENRTFTYRPRNGSVEVNATNVTATALVAPSGFVRNVTYEYDFERGSVSGHRTMTVRYSAVGETTVEVPAWVDEAEAVHANRTQENGT